MRNLKITLVIGQCYKLILPPEVIYEFKFIGEEPIKGKLKDGSIINVYDLMNKGYISIEKITCPK